jgi:hypothetical protein
MKEVLFLRFLLNSKKRVDTIAKYNLDSEVVDVNGLFSTLSKIFTANVYPLPVSLLVQELPQYEAMWRSLPETLVDQEEAYCLQQYQTRIGRSIALAKFSQKKSNPEYVKEIWEELGELYKEDFYEDIEAEFNTENIHTFLEEDRKLIEGIMPSPFKGLNNFLGGGFLPQRLYAFESASKSKKSMLFLYIGMWMAQQGYKVEYVSTELLPLEMRERVTPMAQAFKKPLQIKSYREITEEEMKEAFSGLEGRFSYKFLSCPSMTEVAAYLKGRDYDLVIIDHPSHNFMRPKVAMSANDEWKVVKIIYRDIFKFARENKKAVLLPSWVNRAGSESLKKHHDSESYHTQGSFDTNAILDAKFLIIPREDLSKEGEFTLQFKPLHLRRTGSGVDQDQVIQLVFDEVNCLFREVPTVTEQVKSKQHAMRKRADEGNRPTAKKGEWKKFGRRGIDD